MNGPRSDSSHPVPMPMTDTAETGMEYLAAGSWLPPPVSPAEVMDAIQERRFEFCLGRVTPEGQTDSNVVERLAAAYALLRLTPEGTEPPTVMWETLEALGYDVSATFAERGSDAYFVFDVIRALETGDSVDALRRHMAYQCLGRLWASAFSAPPGYDHYIARSANGGERSNLAFFQAKRPAQLSPLEEARYMRRLVDLLQAAVQVKELPATSVGRKLDFSDWRAPAWAVYLKRPGGKAWRLEVHVKEKRLATNCIRYTVKLIEDSSQETVASIRAIVMEGESGSYDDFIHMATLAGPAVEQTIESVFAPDQVVGLYPRVRWLLEAADNRLFRLMVVEGMYAAPLWRRRGVGQILLQQLLVETNMVDVMIGRPSALEQDADGVLPFGVQAGYAVARLALARYFASMGAEYLISGTMGMRLSALQQLYAAGDAARFGAR